MKMKFFIKKIVVIMLTTLLTALQRPHMLHAQPIEPQMNDTNIKSTTIATTNTESFIKKKTTISVKPKSSTSLPTSLVLTSLSSSNPLLSLAEYTATVRTVENLGIYNVQMWSLPSPQYSSITDGRQEIPITAVATTKTTTNITTTTTSRKLKHVQHYNHNSIRRSNKVVQYNNYSAGNPFTAEDTDERSELLKLLFNNNTTQEQQKGTDFNASNDGEEPMTFYQYCLSHRNSLADLLTLVLYAIVCMVGLLGNTLVIYVVLRFSKMQTVTNIYILNLAIADECFLIGIPFLLYTMRICSWEFGEWSCKAYMVSTSITQFTSSIFLLIMSADRYLAVCHPIVSPRYRTLSNAKLVSSVAWLSSAVLMLPVLLFANTVIQEDGQHVSCNIKWPDAYKRHSGTTFIIYTFALGFATPLCFIMSFYCLVIRKLRRVGPKQRSKEKRRSHRKVTRLVLTVITVYILCWLPHWISQVALITFNPAQQELSRLEILIFLLLGCLAYSNSAMNPLLYAFLSENFRKSFSKAFVCMSGREINAELQAEPSIYTTKNATRKRSTRLPLATAKSNMPVANNNDAANNTIPNIKMPSAVACGYDSGSGGGNQTNTTNSSSAVSSTMANTCGIGARQTNGQRKLSGNGNDNSMHTERSGAQEEALLQTDL